MGTGRIREEKERRRGGGDIPNKTLAATQQLQMNNGLLLPTQPISLPLAIRATIALVAFKHVEVYGSWGSPFDRAGNA
jgi:hypothetical protein